MTDQSIEVNMLRLRLLYLRTEFSELQSRKNEMICHEENILNIRLIRLFGQKQHEIYCHKLEIAMLHRKIEYLNYYVSRNRIPDLSFIDREINTIFQKCLIKTESDAIKLASVRAYVKNNPFEYELLKRATELYKTILPRIHPRIYHESDANFVQFLVQTNSAYITMDISALEKIDSETSKIERHDNTEDIIEFRMFVNNVEALVEKLRLCVERMNFDFPFCYRSKLLDPIWIANEQNLLDNEIEKLEIERKRASDEMILYQLLKPDSFN